MMSLNIKHLWLFVALTAGTVAAQGTAREEAFATAVHEADLRRYVRELVALGPRMGGTPSNEKSAAYLASHFKALGLDVRVEEDAPALAHWEEGWRVELEGTPVVSAHPLGFSPSA
ncbi:MAG: hypothetical protein ACXWVT_13850, partial [Burkholderiaceae bacterium]